MYLYTATEFQGEILNDCSEGELRWIPFDEIPGLNLWEGDRIFLKELLAGKEDIQIELRYEGEKLISVQAAPFPRKHRQWASTPKRQRTTAHDKTKNN